MLVTPSIEPIYSSGVDHVFGAKMTDIKLKSFIRFSNMESFTAMVSETTYGKIRFVLYYQATNRDSSVISPVSMITYELTYVTYQREANPIC